MKAEGRERTPGVRTPQDETVTTMTPADRLCELRRTIAAECGGYDSGNGGSTLGFTLFSNDRRTALRFSCNAWQQRVDKLVCALREARRPR
jgi:hypothetical protein